MKNLITILIVSLVLTAITQGAIIGSWDLNDGSGTTAADGSGYDHDGTLTGTADWGTDYFSFDGSSAFVVASNALFDFTANFTISMTIRVDPSGDYNRCFWARTDYGVWGDGSKEWRIRGSSIQFTAWGIGTSVTGTAIVDDGEWHDVELHYDAATETVTQYIDGSDGQSTNMASMSTRPDNFDMIIGARGVGEFDGDIKNVVVTNDTVVRPPPSTILGSWLLNDGSGTTAADGSGNGNNGILTGAVDWGADYFSFDASNAFVVADNVLLDFTTNFIVSMYIRVDPSGDYNRCFWARTDYGIWGDGSKEWRIRGSSIQFQNT